MKISLNWISDFVDLSDVSAEKVADLLSLHTAEVEGIEVFGEAISDVVVGQVVACGQHPDADKLSVTEVDFGKGENVPVVCGAPNVREGLKIAFAPVGSRLPGDLKIKKAKLRGQVSQGMICSERELEMSEEHDGILELPEDAPVGAVLVDYLGSRDHVLELDNKSLTHRPDLWGHYGFARELAALLDRPLKPLPSDVDWPSGESPWAIDLEDGVGCVEYGAVEIDLGGVPQPSGASIKQRLLAVGQRTVNDIVDLSNYVMLEIGQPTHAFDAATLKGQVVGVRKASEGEEFTTLDEELRVLSGEDMVVVDGGTPIALAGVMGGMDTEVCTETSRILLESAVFAATPVRRTAHRLALRSEASSRFEKTLDPAYAALATARFCHLLLKSRAEARILHAPAVRSSPAVEEVVVDFDLAWAEQLLGITLEKAQVVKTLEALGFGMEGTDGHFRVQVPSWRATKDIRLPIDLVEEVGRMYGYDRIQAAPLVGPVEVPAQQPERLLGRRLAQRLVQVHRSYESQGYTFLDRSWAERLGRPVEDFVRLANPVMADVDLIRRDPVPTLLEQVAENLKERGSGRLCEIAKGYEANSSGGTSERRWLGLVEWGPADLPKDGQQSLFGGMRSIGLDLLKSTGITPAKLSLEPQGADSILPDWAHPVQTLHWRSGETRLGWTCRVHPSILRDLDFGSTDAAMLLFDLEAISALTFDAHPGFTSPSRFPGIKVDVALALPADLAYAEVESQLRRAGGKLLDSMELFDVYSGQGMEEGQRSLAFRCVLRAADRTLGEKEEQKFLRKVESAATEMGGNLRS
ncbi:MAG: phenylalanine--tRNA ligase subunit beta [Planctomycetota bacterium]|jgi:phenylalanyl-tRNA synthetase beta chain